jgi:hypothetical protein
VDGILGYNLLSQAFFHNLLFFHNGILAIRKPFTRTFSFFTMDFWLSGSLSHELFLFSRWNSGYQGAFLTNFFFFHDGILAIKEPFSRTFSFFMMEFWLSRSLSHELFSFFTMELWLSRSLSHELFSLFTMEFSKCAIWGRTLFIYISQRVFT